MQGHEIQRIAIEAAERLPAAECSYPFGPEHQVYKVCGKVFLLLTELRGVPIITLKCEPQQAELHRVIYPSITAGYHMNKRHWITAYPGDDLSPGLIQQLVEDSYHRVVKGIPASRRPAWVG
ncbi:putative DNA-binding protein (MmcQ/YjbR family) [Pantoea agglomerans]|uniref:MmcQ/YjbR family DNA-binding protein n=1 Tax=Pantoea TaxID=53335 RepID=UPI00068BD9B0|nr:MULTISPECIES: MmcQ/YjbR family DNA-binding protein [Pantoea]KOA69616.1 cytoplasmic protein [Pantoea sp. CFSAN033090]MBA8865345.1 putative DNA-binding protein (MmcQ/YjbR family) [Pantoea agglomerans]MBA8892258.1 putative DNA-binding protein (MmcQ/YjbR family) [Pantoea agglomerans]WHU86938.1 MmcQ/YjbR family DNA-binding protein [Pantoea agglomerans pv. gypsophilae]